MEDTLILKAMKGPMKGLTVLLADGERVIFGRSPKCGKGTIAADPAVGWRQFEIDVRLPRAALRSIGKTNATYVNGTPYGGSDDLAGTDSNGAPCREVILRHGDRIQAGWTVFEVVFAALGRHPRRLETPAKRKPETSAVGPAAWELSGVECKRGTPRPAGGAQLEKGIVALRHGSGAHADTSVGGLQIELPDGPPVIRGFTIGRLLQRGSLGGTFAARRDSDGKRVVIKVARIVSALTAAQTDQIRDSLRHLAGLRHPNIVPLLDFGLSSGPPSGPCAAVAAICLEHCDGENLADAVTRTAGRLAPHTIYDILEGTLGALQAAHARGVYHGNLKPQNIFLVRGNKRTHALVADFLVPALSCLQREGRPESISRLDRDLAPFSPPPSRDEVTTPTAAGDLWSLGAIGHFLLHGCPPDKATSAEPARGPGNEKAGRPKSVRGAGQALQQLLREALSGRFRTAAEMAARLAATDRPQVIRLRTDYRGE